MNEEFRTILASGTKRKAAATKLVSIPKSLDMKKKTLYSLVGMYTKGRRKGRGERKKEKTHVDNAVETANPPAEILGTVAKNPLLKLNGSGQNRIPVRYKIPSLLNTCPSATNR